MHKIEDIQFLELELSSYCNAACPLCPRNLFGYPYNSGYKVKHLTLQEVKKLFTPEFISQLVRVNLEGNFGDFAMNPETPEIVQYFLKHNPNIKIQGHTNGSVQRTGYWEKLVGMKIFFCLDGLAGTHEKYRRKTDFHKIVANAQAFINAGGTAIWKMIKFDHNKDQIPQCRSIAKTMRFADFQVVDQGRDTGPVFNENAELEYTIGEWHGERDINKLIDIIDNGDILLEDIDDTVKSSIDCISLKQKEIYISSAGEVYPCCFMGFNPKKYGHGRWHQPVNKQLQEIIQHNNALDVGLEKSIEWFKHIPARWSKDTFENGRLVVCDSFCGKCNDRN